MYVCGVVLVRNVFGEGGEFHASCPTSLTSLLMPLEVRVLNSLIQLQRFHIVCVHVDGIFCDYIKT